MKKIQPKDIIAAMVIGVAAMLLFKGIDTQVGWALIVIVCGYYGVDLTPFIHLGRNQKSKKEKETKDNES